MKAGIVAPEAAHVGRLDRAREPVGSVALVHDYLLVLRGAERTFAAIAECWPEAPIHTLLHDPAATAPMFGGRTVRTSYLERLGVRQDGFRKLLPLFPGAARRMTLDPHEAVISSSSAFAHGVRPAPGADHVCYCHTPFRYVWHERDRGLAEVSRPLRPAMRALQARIRRWDVDASRGVTHYVANSAISRERIAEAYGREAAIVHPPVDVDRFSIGEPEDFFLIATQVVPHKRVELALQAARRAGVAVKVVGGGPDVPRLRAIYGDTVEFMGHVDDDELEGLFRRARALIVPNVEEFGIAAVEAQASGRPVVAADAGGVRETVLPGTTGVLVKPGDVDELAEALRHTEFERFDPLVARMNAERFSASEFQRRFVAEVEYATEGRVRGTVPSEGAAADAARQRRFTRNASA